MSSRGFLLKRAAGPLLAVAAAAALCAPVRAVTVSYTKCQADTSPKLIDQSVDCNFTGDNTWTEDDFHNNRLGGGDDKLTLSYQNLMVGEGDYYDPSSQSYYYQSGVAGGGTYNCWCICSGTDYYGNPFAVSTGGTTYVYVSSS